MIALIDTPIRSVRRRACVIALSAVMLPALVGCAGVTAQQVTAEPLPAAQSPFARLADPGGCVIERITTADHDEWQVQGASADGRWLAMAGRLEAEDGSGSVVRVFEMDLATGEKTDLSHVLQNSGPYSPDNRFIVLAQETANGRTDIFEYERATGALRTVAPHWRSITSATTLLRPTHYARTAPTVAIYTL